VHYLTRSRTVVADEYGEIHVRMRVPTTAPTGSTVVLVVGHDPASVDALVLTVRR
jgi:hypothetical protein